MLVNKITNSCIHLPLEPIASHMHAPNLCVLLNIHGGQNHNCCYHIVAHCYVNYNHVNKILKENTSSRSKNQPVICTEDQ